MPPVDPRQHDRFVLRQRFRLIINQYEFFLPEDESRPFCFVEQARFKFKEDIRFFTDASKTEEVIRIKARQRFDPRATYDVTDAKGDKLGEIQKMFWPSLLRSTYRLTDMSGNAPVIAREKSIVMALIRRFVGVPLSFVPVVGGILESVIGWLPLPYHFEFWRGDAVIGINRRRFGKLIDTYDIDLTADRGRTLDRWMVIAICVGMDALQAR